MKMFLVERKLTKEQVQELRECKGKAGGDMLFWEKMERFYADCPEVMERIEFEKNYLLSLDAIPYTYPCYWKTQKTYLATVEEFCESVGYEMEKEEGYEDCLLEEIAAKFGIDIDINGDGITSFEKYRKN